MSEVVKDTVVHDPVAIYSAIGYTGSNIPPDLIANIETERTKRNTGAIAKCTPEMMSSILDGLEEGNTVEQVCQSVGIARGTFYRWCVLIPAFKDMVDRAHKAQATARMYDHQHKMESIDVDSLDPKLAMAHLRRQEQAARLDLEIAKRRDPATWGDKSQNLNINVNSEVSPLDLHRYQ